MLRGLLVTGTVEKERHATGLRKNGSSNVDISDIRRFWLAGKDGICAPLPILKGLRGKRPSLLL
jgi:hypothetical protein